MGGLDMSEQIQRLAVQPEREKLTDAEGLAGWNLAVAEQERDKALDELYAAKSYLEEADKPFDVFKERDQLRECAKMLALVLKSTAPIGCGCERETEMNCGFICRIHKALAAYEKLKEQSK